MAAAAAAFYLFFALADTHEEFAYITAVFTSIFVDRHDRLHVGIICRSVIARIGADRQCPLEVLLDDFAE